MSDLLLQSNRGM